MELRLKALREETGLSLAQTADAINERYGTKINQSMISKWENGKDIPSLESIRFVADYYETSLDYIILGRKTDMDAVLKNPEIMQVLKELLEMVKELLKSPERKELVAKLRGLTNQQLKVVLSVIDSMK
jgi:transcriptional regulator with XRE-family HTH domain